MPPTNKDKPNGKGMMLTDRDRRLIAAVAEFGVLTREQIARHLSFGSVTRTNAILLRLTQHKYLERRLQPSLRGSRRLTYVLGPHGQELLDGARPVEHPRRWLRATDLFLEHRLLVNDVRLTFEHARAEGYRLERWLVEQRLLELRLGPVPDGYAEYRIDEKLFACFLEADNGTESRTRWRQKVTAYLNLAYSGRFSKAFPLQYFRVLVVVPSRRRLDNIQHEIATQTDRIFWLATISDLQAQGPFASIWRRPGTTDVQSLTESPT
jgi:hypothetical protein